MNKLVDWARESLRQVAYAYYTQIMRLRKPYQYLLVLSHMRSGSSLLTHILASNPAIAGYGETHLDYHSPAEARLLPCQVLLGQRTLWYGKERYALDKILHSDHLSPAQIKFLPVPSTRLIFLLREPEAAMSSIINTLGYSREKASAYYCSRLEDLGALARKVAAAHPFVFITYTQLLEETDATFRLLEDYLALPVPLSEEYELSRATGVLGVGDPSDTIKKGRIVRKPKREMVALPPAILDRVESAYHDLYDLLAEAGRQPDSGS